MILSIPFNYYFFYHEPILEVFELFGNGLSSSLTYHLEFSLLMALVDKKENTNLKEKLLTYHLKNHLKKVDGSKLDKQKMRRPPIKYT